MIDEEDRLANLETDMRRIVTAEWPQRPTVETVEERGPVSLPQWMAALIFRFDELEKKLERIEKFLGVK
jgi:hypothetical protein